MSYESIGHMEGTTCKWQDSIDLYTQDVTSKGKGITGTGCQDRWNHSRVLHRQA